MWWDPNPGRRAAPRHSNTIFTQSFILQFVNNPGTRPIMSGTPGDVEIDISGELDVPSDLKDATKPG